MSEIGPHHRPATPSSPNPQTHPELIMSNRILTPTVDRHAESRMERIATDQSRPQPETTVNRVAAGKTATAKTNRPRGTSERWEGAQAIPKEHVKDLHQHDRTPTGKLLMDFSLLILSGVAAIVAWQAGYYWVSAALWVVGGIVAHIKPLAFHDAAHATLHPSPKMNEALGFAIGTAILVPLSLYRYAHAKHHSNIATEEDPELWPFTVVGTPRWVRRATAFFEITLGFVATPLMFFRAFAVAGSDLSWKMRRRIIVEYVAGFALWVGFFTMVSIYGWWTEALVGVVAPWVVTGMLQTINKYVEHMGLMGVGVMASSRSVVPADQIGEAFSTAWQNVAHHGTHHLYAKIPHYNLPEASTHVMGTNPPEGSVFPSYTSAMIAMIKTLGDPKIGPQWKTANSGGNS